MQNTNKAVTDEGKAPRVDYYRVKIVETGAQLFSGDYSTFNVERKHFSTLDEVRAFLKEHYGKAKRQPMYCEPNGEHIGYCYKFRNADWSHAPVEKWNQCDWVTVAAVNERPIIKITGSMPVYLS